jgi:hypothetical protein
MNNRKTRSTALMRALVGVAVALGGVAVVAATAVSATTPNGTWSASTMPANDVWTGVAYGNGTYVAVNLGASSNPQGSDLAAYSTNAGATWSTSTMTTTSVWSDIAYGDGEFVAVSQGGDTIDYSSNGVTWSSTTIPGGNAFETVAYGGGVFVAVGEDGSTGLAWYSDNGVNWTQGTIAVAGVVSVVYGDGEFVGVSEGAGSSNSAVYSSNGVNWTATTLQSSDDWEDVAYADGEFVAVNWSDSTYDYSSNGSAWSASAFPGNYDGGGIVGADGGFIAFDDEGNVYTSINGTSWTAGIYGTGSFNLGNGVATNAHTVVAVPYGGDSAEIFTQQLAAQSIDVTSTAGTSGTSLPLTAGGYSGTGAITFVIGDSQGTASGCSITAGVLSSTSAGTCDVVASIAADSNYAGASSASTPVTFTAPVSPGGGGGGGSGGGGGGGGSGGGGSGTTPPPADYTATATAIDGTVFTATSTVSPVAAQTAANAEAAKYNDAHTTLTLPVTFKAPSSGAVGNLDKKVAGFLAWTDAPTGGATTVTLEAESGATASVADVLRGARRATAVLVDFQGLAPEDFHVTSVTSIATRRSLPAAMFKRAGGSRLVVVTCGGTYDAKSKHWSKYIATSFQEETS